MNRPNVINVPASIRNRLLNKSKETKRPFLEILQYYAMERFLYRLSVSPHVNKFFLKGALMFKVWNTASHRPTMDIDLLGKTKNTVENLKSVFCDICQQKISLEDGMLFLPDTVRGSVIQTEAEYEGIRIEFEGDLNKAIVSMQIDVGFGDVISPDPQILSYPTILEHSAPQLQGYTHESVIAEKLETMFKRGMLNSRMKDFFDIWTLSQQFSFSSKKLVNAVKATFNQRGTDLQSFPECFSEAFVSDPLKNSQWNAFIRKNYIQHGSLTLKEVVLNITTFLAPVLIHSQENHPSIDLTWYPPDKWIE